MRLVADGGLQKIREIRPGWGNLVILSRRSDHELDVDVPSWMRRKDWRLIDFLTQIFLRFPSLNRRSRSKMNLVKTRRDRRRSWISIDCLNRMDIRRFLCFNLFFQPSRLWFRRSKTMVV